MIGNIADSNVAKSVRRHLTWSQNWFSKLEPSLTSLKFPAVLVLFLAFVMQEEKVTIAFAPVVHSFISFFWTVSELEVNPHTATFTSVIMVEEVNYRLDFYNKPYQISGFMTLACCLTIM